MDRGVDSVLIVLYMKGARERWGSRIAFVAFALVLCYWGLLAFAHSRAVARGGEEAARLASANGETVARLAAMPTLANPFRWDCVFETDRATYRFSLEFDRRTHSLANPVRYVKTPELWKQFQQQRPARVFLGFARFPVAATRGSRTALLKLSFNWPTCVTLNRADREAVSHLNFRSIVRCSNKK